MIRVLLARLGVEVVYTCSFGTYADRYTDDQWAAHLPKHTRLVMAPPWAKMKLRRLPSRKGSR